MSWNISFVFFSCHVLPQDKSKHLSLIDILGLLFERGVFPPIITRSFENNLCEKIVMLLPLYLQ